jgi:hypothetical protein
MVEGGLLRSGYGVLTATAAMGAEERRGTSRQERMKGDGGARDQERIGFLVRV